MICYAGENKHGWQICQIWREYKSNLMSQKEKYTTHSEPLNKYQILKVSLHNENRVERNDPRIFYVDRPPKVLVDKITVHCNI